MLSLLAIPEKISPKAKIIPVIIATITSESEPDEDPTSIAKIITLKTRQILIKTSGSIFKEKILFSSLKNG